MRDKVRVGIVGLGHMGSIHFSKLKSDPDCVITAIYDTDKSKYDNLASPNIIKCKHIDEFIKYIDAVVIASPSSTHFNYLNYFLSNNIHCLCEKPPVTDSKDLEKLIAISKKRRLLFNVVMPERENSVIKYILENAENKGYVFQSDRVSPFVMRGTDVSVLYDIMIHDVDILVRIIPFKIKRINATGLSVLTGRIDILNVRIEYENGSFAILNASRLAAEKKRKVRIFYKGGYISADLLNLTYNHTILKSKNILAKNDKYALSNSDPIKTIDNDFIDMIISKKKNSKYCASSLLNTLKLCNQIDKKTMFAKIN